jgi:hypothetical protein
MEPLSDFFALGGNSLLCGKMNSRIRTGLHLPGLSGMLIYQNTTLAEFSQAVAVAGAMLPSGYCSSMSVTTASSISSLEDDVHSPAPSSNGVSDLQHFIADAWAEALGCAAASIGPQDDFFALGGNSLLCGKMNSRIRSGLHLPSLSGMLIYQNTTLEAFTEAVAATGAMLPAAYRLQGSSSSSSSQAGQSSSGTEITGVDTILEADALSDFIAAAWAETLGLERSSLGAGKHMWAVCLSEQLVSQCLLLAKCFTSTCRKSVLLVSQTHMADRPAFLPACLLAASCPPSLARPVPVQMLTSLHWVATACCAAR